MQCAVLSNICPSTFHTFFRNEQKANGNPTWCFLLLLLNIWIGDLMPEIINKDTIKLVFGFCVLLGRSVRCFYSRFLVWLVKSSEEEYSKCQVLLHCFLWMKKNTLSDGRSGDIFDRLCMLECFDHSSFIQDGCRCQWIASSLSQASKNV